MPLCLSQATGTLWAQCRAVAAARAVRPARFKSRFHCQDRDNRLGNLISSTSSSLSDPGPGSASLTVPGGRPAAGAGRAAEPTELFKDNAKLVNPCPRRTKFGKP